MDEIQQAKDSLKEIHDFFIANIREGNFKNEGYSDGLSEQYNFQSFSLVISKDPILEKAELYTYYNGDEEFAQVQPNGQTNLDNEFTDEIDKVLELHQEFREELKVHNQSKLKNKSRRLKR